MFTELHQIKTKDNIPLEGLLFKPSGKKLAAVFWVGGLSSRFSKSPQRTFALAQILGKAGVAFAIFDHRGFGTINTVKIQVGKNKKHVLAGTGFEKFEHSIFDIEAVIRFLRKQGYKKIFLLGHNTGANKSAFYIWKRNGRGLSGVGLLGPLSDIPILKKDLGRKYRVALDTARKMMAKRQSKELLPFSLVNGGFWSAERFWSIAREKSNEDTFPYYDPKRTFRWTNNVRLPILVLIVEQDQYADRPTDEILKRFKKEIPPRWFNGILLKNADHNFTSEENELAYKLRKWVVNTVKNNN
ncbi:MAG: DUF1749 domain-containing protein [Candidatus Yanofskybacteria bacterium]|nr:DUF1749 domain-containing protein [Candidatus Yanofskybacteria bacterium]